MITTATAKENAERIKRFRDIASGDQFTTHAVEDIKASITESESQGNKYNDRMRDDHIPPNRKMMVPCKQKDKWIAAEEDELRSFAVNKKERKKKRNLSKKRRHDKKAHHSSQALVSSIILLLGPSGS